MGTASIYLLRLPEVVYGAQIIAGAGLVVWFGRGDFTSLPPALATLTTVLVLMHWWQHEKVYVIARWWRTLWESGFALAVVAVLGVWVFTRYETRELYLTPPSPSPPSSCWLMPLPPGPGRWRSAVRFFPWFSSWR